MKKILISVFLFFVMACEPILGADYFELGKAAFAKKDYRQANVYFVQALTQNPNNANCRYYYAQTLTYLNNYEQAKKEYGYVIMLAPNSVAANYSKQAIAYIDDMNLANKKNNQTTQTGRNSANNYIKKALTSSGELVTWDLGKMPLKVYVNNSLRVNNSYVEAAKSALANWETASDGLVSFTYVNDPSVSDIDIVFKGIAQKTENQILGFTQHRSDDGYINKVQVTLYTIGPNYQALTDTDVYNVSLHEFGHALGIWGHSDDKNDVMYALYDINNQKSKILLSSSDKNTVRAIYEIDKNPYATGMNSINNVLGSKYDRMEDKLKQNLAYIKEVPGNPIGYVNVANTYKAMNKEYDAIIYYKKALEIDSNYKEANLALANIYFNRNDLKNAEIYYKALIKIEPKNTMSYYNLINLYIRNNQISNANSVLSNLLYRNPAAKNDENIKALMKRLGKS